MELCDADLVRFAARFQGRPGVHARMWHHPARGSGYSPVQAPLDAEVARQHLEGRVTVGTYLVRPDHTVGQAVLDLDATRPALEAAARDRRDAEALQQAIHDAGRQLVTALQAAGLQPLLVDSGFKGRHLWCFFDAPVPAAHARAGLAALVRAVPIDPRLRIEVFPKQDQTRPGGLGNLVKLPLGVHLRTGRISAVLDEAGLPTSDGLRRLLCWPTSPAPPVPSGGAPVDERPLEVSPVAARGAPTLLGACSVVRAVLASARQARRIGRGAALVLNHSLGHLVDGVELLQELYAGIPDLPVPMEPRSPLRGHPISCAKIRKRLPELANALPCDCVFPDRSGTYAHPLRHLDGSPEPWGARFPACVTFVGV